MKDAKSTIEAGKAILGIEFGSTRIKAVLIDQENKPIAQGSHTWENQLVDGLWTYSIEAIWAGVQDCYADLRANVKSQYGIEIENLAAIGISAMMHGYMAFNDKEEILVPFRTWRNTNTGKAAAELSELFVYNIPLRWKLAMENTDTPSALILSRQNINMLPEGTDYSQAAKGAYIVAGSDENPDVIMVASGSEVSTLVAGAELLHKDGVKTRIVSVPSEGLFRSQSKEYQESILPAGAKVFGLTAGLPVNLLGLVGANGKIWGLESFGFSAPYKVLDEKLGFTAENVYNQVKEML